MDTDSHFVVSPAREITARMASPEIRKRGTNYLGDDHNLPAFGHTSIDISSDMQATEESLAKKLSSARLSSSGLRTDDALLRPSVHSTGNVSSYALSTLASQSAYVSSAVSLNTEDEYTTKEEEEEEEEGDDEESVQSLRSLERIIAPRRRPSLGRAHKQRGSDRWDTNLMEDSMPGLVSFCNSSTVSEACWSLARSCSDNDSVSSLDCSLNPSQHSRIPMESNHSTRDKEEDLEMHSRWAATIEEDQSRCKVLEPCREMRTLNQEKRWSGVSLHHTSDSLPTISRKLSKKGESLS